MSRRWLTAVLARIREMAARRKVRFTMKALQALAALDLGLDEDDACDVLAKLVPSNLAERLVSKKTGEWMYVCKPSVGAVVVDVKVVLRSDCVVISFHEQEDHGDEDE
jgi:hypothetical protein